MSNDVTRIFHGKKLDFVSNFSIPNLVVVVILLAIALILIVICKTNQQERNTEWETRRRSDLPLANNKTNHHKILKHQI